MRTRRIAVGAALVVTASSLQTGTAFAGVTATTDPLAFARSFVEDPSVIVEASFPTRPSDPASAAIADSAFADFPVHGPSYAIMSTGKAVGVSGTLPGYTTEYNFGTQAPHPDPHGSDAYRPADPAVVYDATAFRLAVHVPLGADCLKVNTRFFSDEIGSAAPYNDQFRVFLDHENVAFDDLSRWIEVASASAPGGEVAYATANAAGTAYNAGTALLTHQAPVTPGGHYYLSFWIYDIGDGHVDSTAFIDRLSFGSSDAGCRAELPVQVSRLTSATFGKKTTFSVGYSNPTTVPLTVDSIQVQMPEGMTYVAGSTQGATTSDPTIEGSTLSWAPGAVDAEADGSLTFRLKAASAGAKSLAASVLAGDHSGSGTIDFKVAKAASTTTLDVLKKREKVKGHGKVKPNHAGSKVKVTLFRKEGGVFREKASARVDLTSTSRYAASFSRLPSGTCKLTARFRGDAHHKPSSASKTFNC